MLELYVKLCTCYRRAAQEGALNLSVLDGRSRQYTRLPYSSMHNQWFSALVLSDLITTLRSKRAPPSAHDEGSQNFDCHSGNKLVPHCKGDKASVIPSGAQGVVGARSRPCVHIYT